MTLQEEYAQNYWQLANIVTGFAVAEVIGTLFAIGSSTIFAEGVRRSRYLVVFFTLIAHIIYLWGIYFCHTQEVMLIPADEAKVLTGIGTVFVGREIAVILSAGLLIYMVLVA